MHSLLTRTQTRVSYQHYIVEYTFSVSSSLHVMD